MNTGCNNSTDPAPSSLMGFYTALCQPVGPHYYQSMSKDGNFCSSILQCLFTIFLETAYRIACFTHSKHGFLKPVIVPEGQMGSQQFILQFLTLTSFFHFQEQSDRESLRWAAAVPDPMTSGFTEGVVYCPRVMNISQAAGRCFKHRAQCERPPRGSVDNSEPRSNQVVF